eukprot:4294608-Prymnesium_polylepis.1
MAAITAAAVTAAPVVAAKAAKAMLVVPAVVPAARRSSRAWVACSSRMPTSSSPARSPPATRLGCRWLVLRTSRSRNAATRARPPPASAPAAAPSKNPICRTSSSHLASRRCSLDSRSLRHRRSCRGRTG